MTRYFLLLLFFILLAGDAYFENLNYSFAPGLSVKNAILYTIFLGIAIDAAVTSNRRLELMSVIVPFSLFIIYGILSWLFVLTMLDYPGYDPLEQMISVKSEHIDLFLIFLVFFYGVSSANDAMWLLRMMLWVVMAGNVITMIDAWNIPDLGLLITRRDDRVSGPLAEPNQYGAFLALLLPALIVFYRTEVGKTRFFSGVGVVFSVFALVATASRGAIVGILMGGTLAAVYLRRYISLHVVLRAIAVGIAMSFFAVTVLVAFGYGDLLYERLIIRSVDTNLASLSSIRTAIWRDALSDMFNNALSFITGYGWGAYQTSNRYHYATHNVYLNLLYNLGIIGVALFLTTAINALSTARRAMRYATKPMFSYLQAFVFGLIAVLIAAFFVDLPSTNIFIWAYTGVMMRIAVVSQQLRDPTVPKIVSR